MRTLTVGMPDGHGLIASQIVDAIGRKDFGARLLQTLNSALHPDLVSMFVHHDERPVLLDHHTLAKRFDEQKAIRSYMSSHYREDPVSEAIASSRLTADPLALYMTRAEVPTISYRRQCYEEAHIADRFTIVGRTSRNEAVSVNLYRAERSGPMDETCLAEALALTPVLCAAVIRHCELAVTRDGRDPERILLHLIERFSTLTMREAQCAAHAIAGFTADQSAAKLGIKASSVITHRKRAYARLDVLDLRDLTSLYFAEG